MPRFLITGCSGGGKSTLIRAFAARGYRTVAEPGLRVIESGTTPWDDPIRFLEATWALARADLLAHQETNEPVFFDRGMIDAAAGLQRIGRHDQIELLYGQITYHRLVFLAPPWRKIFTVSEVRRHSFDDACREFEHLERLLPQLGYVPVLIPKVTVVDRSTFVTRIIRHCAGSKP